MVLAQKPGLSHPRIARVSLMVRVKFSLNKFQSTLVLKTSRAIIFVSTISLNTAPGTSTSVGEISQDHHCHTHSRSPIDASHNIVCTNMTRDKARTPNSASHLVVWLNHHCLDPHHLQKRWLCASSTSQLSLIHEFEWFSNHAH